MSYLCLRRKFLARGSSCTAGNLKVQQSGAALVVCLVILLVMTVVGVNSMDTLVLEERMAANSRQANVAAQQAESALRLGEGWLAANVSNVGNLSQFSNGTPGLYSMRSTAPGVTALRPGWDIFDQSNWTAANSIDGPDIAGIDPDGSGVLQAGDLVSQNPRYMIEYMGRLGPPPGDLLYGGVDDRFHAFRVTAMGWGEQGNARYIAQSTVRRCLIGGRCELP